MAHPIEAYALQTGLIPHLLNQYLIDIHLTHCVIKMSLFHSDHQLVDDEQKQHLSSRLHQLLKPYIHLESASWIP